jgi:glycosyltransferase involved in cell wall biosynthesis
MLILTAIYSFNRRRQRSWEISNVLSPDLWPVVTVQLPLYNEQQVARRLIDAIAKLDYPSDRLYIQVLDDSTDSTVEIVDCAVSDWKSRRRWIDVLRRGERIDFKAGALRAGLECAQGEYIAIFDADFVPPPEWLKCALAPYFGPGSEKIGLVQTRWGHLNDDFSFLTRAQALALDGHFAIEQSARSSAGLLLNFNGTAGIWRRSCIVSAGNWRGATLSEDLDLSYRAQLIGWKICYRSDVMAPAEIPAYMAGFKRQQFRWAKGSIQVARLLTLDVLRSPISWWRKIQGVLHLTAYLGHPLMMLLVLLMLPLSMEGKEYMQQLPLGWLGIAGLGAPILYAVAQNNLYSDKPGLRWLVRFPLLVMLGVGITVNNTRAVMEALFGVRSAFERTPKTGVMRQGKRWQSGRHERIRVSPSTWLELILALYTLVITIIALRQGNWVGALFSLIYTFGFTWVMGATLWEAHGLRIKT